MRKTLYLFICLPLMVSGQHAFLSTSAQVDSIILVSRTFTTNQDFEQAISASAAAEQMARACCGTESPAYANACFNEGRIRYFLGQNDTALRWYLQAKNIREIQLGTLHPDYGKSLNNLAALYSEMGLLKKAEALYVETLAIRKNTAGTESATYAAALGNLAGLYQQLGEFEQAEIFGLEALGITERILGKKSADYASRLNNLANLYYNLGNYPKAEEYYVAAKAIRESLGDTDSQAYLLGLDNLGGLYFTKKDFVRAEVIFKEAMRLRKQNLGEQHSDYLLSQNHLADLYRATNQLELAESTFVDVVENTGLLLGKEHINYAICLQNYAELCMDKKEYERSLAYNLEARNIFQKQFGKEYDLLVRNQSQLLKNYFALHNTPGATRCLTELAAVKRQKLQTASRYMSERELYLFSEQFNWEYVGISSFIPDYPEYAGTCYDDVLFYKGFLLNTVRETDRLMQNHPEAADIYVQLQACYRQLSAFYSRSTAEQEGLAELEEKANLLEKSSVKRVNGLETSFRQVNWQQVQQQLQPGEAAVEFIRYPYYHPQYADSTLYAALVLLPDATQPVFIPLFEETDLLQLLKTNGRSPIEFNNSLYAVEGNGARLYQFIWQPLMPLLSKVNKLYHAKDGLLHRLNFGAIPAPDGRVMAETLQLVSLNSTRQLATRNRTASPNTDTHTALLYGGIVYDAAVSATEANPNTAFNRQRGISWTNTDSTLRSKDWKYLPWTKIEISTVGDILNKAGYKAQLYEGLNASEESIKKVNSPEVLHIATHGYFFPDPPQNQQKDGATVAFQGSDYPMIRSGLALSGANYAWKNGKPRHPEMEDGVLTALEASRLNLENTALVVLSACETGLGDIQGNEGVYGLQRAFKMAGARYLIMSLWQVPDFQAQAFMTAFYTHWLAGREPIPDAFRKTQLEMKEKFKNPFLWAGFVLVE